MLFRALDKLSNKKCDAAGLAVFRMAYAVILFCETLQLYRYRDIVYDVVQGSYVGEIDPAYIFRFWFAIQFLLFIGLFTRFASIVNYMLGVIIFSSAIRFEYHVFYAFVGMNFLLMFMPVSRVMSLDSLLQKLKYTNIGRAYKPDRKVLTLNYLVPVFVIIALVYFDSIFRKVMSPMWMDGLGVWLPCSLPFAVWSDLTPLLNQEYLMKFLGYLVVVFETVFIFLFWSKKVRWPFVIIGVFFHMGILISYPIPWFALAVVGMYLLMVPASFWTAISAFFKSKSQSYTFYYDAECPLCNKVVVVIKHFDLFNKVRCATVQGNASQDNALKGIDEETLLINIHGVTSNGGVFVGYDAYVKLFDALIYTFPLGLVLRIPGISHLGKRIYIFVAGNRLTERCTAENCAMPVFSAPPGESEDFLVHGWNKLSVSKFWWKCILVSFSLIQLVMIISSPSVMSIIPSEKARTIISTYEPMFKKMVEKPFGLTEHPVFMYDLHFDGYNHIFKIVNKETGEIVPLADERGLMSGSYATGALWINYTFRTNGKFVIKDRYEERVIRYLNHFMAARGMESGTFDIYIKEISTTDKWQKDFLKKQIAKPWRFAGNCELAENKADYIWQPFMDATFEQELSQSKK